MQADNLLIETEGAVALIRLHRPQQLNALNDALMDELGAALAAFDADDSVRCIVITGSDKAFAAGADIAAMADKTFEQVAREDFITRNWEQLKKVRKPVIAAVAGYALGGGCELALMCDIVLAADNAKFGQPEIKLGIIPGAGGTQRLPRAIGKSKAMELVLSGRLMDAQEAERSGLVARVVPLAELLEQALALAQSIAAMPLQALLLAKESVNRAWEGSLNEGLLFERRAFHSLFATADQKEGMAAFLAKRPPNFQR